LEYAAFAINYAALVLGRKAITLSWSLGNLNTQWALKYWPSARTNLKNYVAMSPDYDGTILASFLCDPSKLLTQNLGTLMQDFLTDDGLPMDLQGILGIGALPISGEQFTLYLLALLSGNMEEFLTNSTSDTISLLPKSTSTANTATVNSVAIGAAVRKRALDLAERQGAGGNPSALAQLLAALTDPIAQALASLAAEPGSVLEEVVSNIGGHLLNLQVPAAIPQGCLPLTWQQVYFSNLVNVLHTDYGNGAGDSAFVPTTTVFSFTDEIVQP
jgi:hypothetical protein